MYNIEKISEVTQKHGFAHENDERTCWNLGAGLHIRFDDDMDEPGVVISHSGRDYFSRKFTMDEIESILEVITLFNLGTDKIIEIYDNTTENNEVVGMIYRTDFEAMQEQIKILTANLDGLAEDYNGLLEEHLELSDSYKVAKENIERLVDENNELDKSNRSNIAERARMRDDYLTYRRVLSCIMSQFEGRDDW